MEAGPAQPDAFAGLRRSAVGSAAYNLWLAVGDRPADRSRRAAASLATRDIATDLPVIVSSLGSWGLLVGGYV